MLGLWKKYIFKKALKQAHVSILMFSQAGTNYLDRWCDTMYGVKHCYVLTAKIWIHSRHHESIKLAGNHSCRPAVKGKL